MGIVKMWPPLEVPTIMWSTVMRSCWSRGNFGMFVTSPLITKNLYQVPDDSQIHKEPQALHAAHTEN